MAIDWNLDGFAVISFNLNQCRHLFVFVFSSNNNSSGLVAVTENVLSSAKLHRAPLLKYQKISFMKIFNSRGPSIDPCGTPCPSLH